MTALVLLKRSDANLVLVACCEGNGSELAEELSKQQAFTVGVVACLPALGGYVCNVQAALAENHVINGWYAMGVGEAIRIASWVFDATVDERQGAELPQNVVANLKHKCLGQECCQEALSVVADATPKRNEGLEQECCHEAPNAKDDKARNRNEDGSQGGQDILEDATLTINEEHSEMPDDEEDNGEEMSEMSGARSNDSLSQQNFKEQSTAATREAIIARATQCLEACPREQADTATTIKTWIAEQFGKDVAVAVLLNYEERVLRKGRGEANQRMILDSQGHAVRLKAL